MSSIQDQARTLVRGSGARVTAARIAVLAELLEAGEALTHGDVQLRLERHAGHGPGIDRVTLYRVLDWLVEKGLAHRVPDPDRVFRFSAQSAGGHGGQHGHFRCLQCQSVYCLAEGPGMPDWLAGVLPEGFTGEQLELTVAGRCARCTQAAGKAGRALVGRNRPPVGHARSG